MLQVMRKPDGKRPLVTNIAELGAGLLSHADLDATDITAALLLASAAQNRRRRLRIARALLPVYQALRDGGGLSSSGSAVDERASTSGVEEEDSDDDASSEATSVNDVPADRDLDRMIAEREAERRQEAGRRLAEQQAPKLAGVGKADGAPQRGTAQPSPLGPRRRGKTVSWAQDRLEQAAAAAAVAPRPRNAAPARGPPDLSGISLPPPALRLQQQQQAKEQAEEQQQPEQLQADMQAPAGGVDLGGSLPLTADNVSLWEEHVAAVQGRQALIDHPVEAVLGMGDSGPAAASDAEKAAGELLEQMPSELPHQAWGGIPAGVGIGRSLGARARQRLPATPVASGKPACLPVIMPNLADAPDTLTPPHTPPPSHPTQTGGDRSAGGSHRRRNCDTGRRPPA